MHTLKVTLKQHTPLIHFQHDQEGATLRASEVKPKLDKFILTKLGNGDYQQGINTAKENKWLVGKGEHPALDYKMRIDINSNSTRTEYLLASYIKGSDAKNLENREIKVISNSPFFAQEKQNSQIVKSHNVIADWNKIEKKGMDKSDDTNVLILTKKEHLFSEILKYIQLFFISTNFGTRQSKGFGCFLPTKIEYNQKNKELKNNEELLKQEFSFVYKKTLQSTIRKTKSPKTQNEKSKKLDTFFSQCRVFFFTLRRRVLLRNILYEGRGTPPYNAFSLYVGKRPIYLHLTVPSTIS